MGAPTAATTRAILAFSIHPGKPCCHTYAGENGKELLASTFGLLRVRVPAAGAAITTRGLTACGEVGAFEDRLEVLAADILAQDLVL